MSVLLRLLREKARLPVHVAKEAAKSLWNFYVRKRNNERPAGSPPLQDLKQLHNEFSALSPEQKAQVTNEWGEDTEAKNNEKSERENGGGDDDGDGFCEYPLGAAVMESIEDNLDELLSKFLERMNNESVLLPTDPIELGAPKRLCGHKFGAGHCGKKLSAHDLATFESIHKRVLSLSEYNLPDKTDLNSVVLLLHLFRFYPTYAPGESAPSAPPQLVALLLFSLRVGGYLRSVWIDATTPHLRVLPGEDVPMIYRRDRVLFDQDVTRKIMEWKRTWGVHHYEFSVERKTLKHLTILAATDISTWQKPTSVRTKTPKDENDEIASLAKKPQPKARPRGKAKTRATGKRRRVTKKSPADAIPDDCDAGVGDKEACSEAEDGEASETDDGDHPGPVGDGGGGGGGVGGVGGGGGDCGGGPDEDVIADDKDGLKLDKDTEDMIEMSALPWMVPLDSKDNPKHRGKVFRPEDGR